MKTIKNTLFVIILGIFAFVACEKVDVTNKVIAPLAPEVKDNPSGLGSNPGKPYCAPFILPSGIEFVGDLQSSSFKSTIFDKENQNAEDFIMNPKTNFIPLGSGSLVQIYMKFRNKNPFKQTLIIPGGLVFCPMDTTSQTGVIVQPDTLIINPNDSIGVLLKAYCTNLHKHVPSNTKFNLIGVSLHSDLNTVVGILKNKQKLQQGSKLQNIIWNISDRGGLQDEDLDYLNSLP